ncbi:tetratricopeptide repeat protein [Brevibacillus massiliensis]|uniref:tetratricopeptide repeat protein n=1 Tax=Brevibacillus massiliensis TaxID=1118054 RepID=UPI0002DE007A|nr:tetratricopeptide repeat protein [Brevibacillus massiliensis]
MTKQWFYVIDEAVKKVTEGEVELGLAALRKVQEHGWALPEVMLYLADVWYQLGHLNESSGLLHEIMRRHPDLDVETRQECELLLAEVALDESDYEQAETLLYKVKDEGYEGSRLNVLLADLFSLQGLDEVAVKYLALAQQQEPENQELKAALGDMYIRLARFEEAKELLGGLDRHNLSHLLVTARLYAQNGQFEQAYGAYQNAAAIEPAAEALFGCGMMAFHLGLLTEAKEYVEALLAVDEEYMTAYPLLADILQALGKTDGAIEALERYVELSGFDTSQVRRLTALLQQTGRQEQAKEYQKLLEQWYGEDEE